MFRKFGSKSSSRAYGRCSSILVHRNVPSLISTTTSLADIERVSDPEAALYQRPVFGLGRMHPALHLLVPEVWKAWVQGAIRKHGIGLLREDADQMPGVFYLRDRAIVRAFRYRTIADQPDYLKLIH